MARHVLSILVENQSGVLSRVTGLFSRRGFNIDSLSVGETENPEYSRITVVAQGDDVIIEQIKKQLEKLVDTKNVIELFPEESVYRELALIKICAPPSTRSEITGIVDIFRAGIIDVSREAVTVEITGDSAKISAFRQLMEPFGIIEIARTGLTGLQRGEKSIMNFQNKEEN